MRWTDVSGVIHVHTEYSGDSSATLEDIDRSALWGRADFVIVTDHNSMGLKANEGWRDRYLLLVGHEVTPPESDHYLVLRVESPVDPRLGPQDVIDEVERRGGLGFIEHPFFEGNPRFRACGNPWTDWSVKGFTGMSIFNFTADWGARLTPLRFLVFRFLPSLATDVPNPRTLAKWDQLTLQRRVVGIGTVDAHRWIRTLWGWEAEAHPFRYYFRSVRTHVLLSQGFSGNLNDDAQMIYEGIQAGRCYVSNSYLGDARGFQFCSSCGEQMGSEVNGPIGLEVSSPAWGRLRLLKDGRLFRSAWGKKLACAMVTPGVYRAEVWIWHRYRFKPWVFSNPIHVR